MHPKRHPVWMDISLACDEKGLLTGLKLRAVGDTGAYASVGTKVMERVAGHAGRRVSRGHPLGERRAL